MRYINKEFGFSFRPPFFDKFYEERTDGPTIDESNFPCRYIQGAGYDYSAINGAALVGKYGSMWGIKVSYFDGKKWLDNDDFSQNMRAGCANTVDGSFAHFAGGQISVKWVRHNEQSMIIQVSARRKMRVRIIFYPCYGFAGELSIDGAVVNGRSPYMAIIPGTINLSDTNAVFKDRHLVLCDDYQNREYFFAKSYNTPSDSANGAFNEAIMEFVINENQPSVYLYAIVGDEEVLKAEAPRLDKVQKQIETAELRYGVNKTMGTGALGAPTERMLNSVLWSRIYYPFLLTEIYSPQRALLNQHFDIKGLEENCSAILGSYTGIEKVKGQLRYTVEDKILAVLAIWHTFAHAVEKSDILHFFKPLQSLYPPASGLVVSSADRNEVAYKWGDSPLKETKRGAASHMYSLDMSCLKLLAFDILERICAMFDMPERNGYERAKAEMIQLINDTFWNEHEGLYVNRYVTGMWASSIGATSFYPLIAGAVDSPEKLAAIVNNFTDQNKFWDNYIVPTLIKSSSEYGKKGSPNNNGERTPPYLEYRGSIVPYVNYIIYQGLCRYGLDELAAEMAQKSAKLWVNNENDNVENYSVYLPTGKRYKAKEYLSSNGNMLALIGLQAMIDLEYFRNDLKTFALKFGSFAMGNNSVTNLKLLNRSYSVDINDNSTMLIIDNVRVFYGEGGKFVVRGFLESRTGCEFYIDAQSSITIDLNIPNNKQVTKYFFIVPIGKSKVVAQNGTVTITSV